MSPVATMEGLAQELREVLARADAYMLESERRREQIMERYHRFKERVLAGR